MLTLTIDYTLFPMVINFCQRKQVSGEEKL